MPTTSTSRPELDLTGTSCPMAFVKARIYLDQCKTDDIIQITYDNTPANEPLERSIRSLGHLVLSANGSPPDQAAHSPDKNTPERPHTATLQVKRITVQVKK